MNKYFHHTFYWACDYLFILELSLFHVSKREPWSKIHQKSASCLNFLTVRIKVLTLPSRSLIHGSIWSSLITLSSAKPTLITMNCDTTESMGEPATMYRITRGSIKNPHFGFTLSLVSSTSGILSPLGESMVKLYDEHKVLVDNKIAVW